LLAPSALHDLARMAGAMTIGNPPQYLFTREQLQALLYLIDPRTADLIALHDRLVAAGKKADLSV
jgi:hypothetical protein